jgi:hypothetical protein
MAAQGQVIVANRVVRIGGRDYAPGEPVDTSNLSDAKVGQLLNLRLLRPGHPSDIHMEPRNE